MTHRSRKYFGYPAKDYCKIAERIITNMVRSDFQKRWENGWQNLLERYRNVLESEGIFYPKQNLDITEPKNNELHKIQMPQA